MKSVNIPSFFWSVFSRIRAENGKIRTRKNFIFGPLSRKEMFINHFCSMFLFYILSQPFYIGFLVFSGVINWEHWPEMVSLKYRNSLVISKLLRWFCYVNRSNSIDYAIIVVEIYGMQKLSRKIFRTFLT